MMISKLFSISLMRKIITIIFFNLFCFCGLAQKDYLENKEIINNVNSFSNRGIKFNYPTNWIISENDLEDGNIYQITCEKNDYLSPEIITILCFDGEINAEGWIILTIEEIKKQFGLNYLNNSSIIESFYLGYYGYTTTYSVSLFGESICGFIASFETIDKSFLIAKQSSEPDKLNSEFIIIENSLRIDDILGDYEISSLINDKIEKYLEDFYNELEHNGWIGELFKDLKNELTQLGLEDIKNNPITQIEIANFVFNEIRESIDYQLDVYSLNDIVHLRRANCLGYSQIFEIFTNRLGLNVGIKEVYKDKFNKVLINNRYTHVCNVLFLSNGNEVLIDLAYNEFDINHLEVSDYFVTLEKVYCFISYNKGASYDAKNRFKMAKEEYKNAISLNNEFALAHFNLGLIYGNEKKFTKAEIELKKAVSIYPNFAYAYWNLGVILLNSNRTKEAEAYFKKSIEINSYDDMAHYNYGVLLLNSGKLSEAEYEFRSALNINDELVNAYVNLGIALIGQNNIIEAKNKLEIARDLYLQQGNLSEAEKIEDLLSRY